MKITLDLTSVVVGGAVALALGVVAGFSPQATQVPGARPATAVSTMGANRPAARNIVLLEAKAPERDSSGAPIPGTGFDCAPFVVPAGKILVITALTGSDAFIQSPHPNGQGYSIGVEIDGVQRRFQTTALDGGTGRGGSPHLSLGLGIPLQAGQTTRLVTPIGGNVLGASVFLHGYLEDA